MAHGDRKEHVPSYDDGLERQAGEYRVAAELCRLNLVTAPFAGNVPHYDIIATVENGRHVAIQVKTSRGGAWQFDAGNCAKITMRGRRHDIGRKKRAPLPGLLCALVLLAISGQDGIFVMRWEDLRNIVLRGYRRYLAKHGGLKEGVWR